MKYNEFIERKLQYGNDSGFEPVYENPMLFDFQKYLVDWSVRKGRGAMFADCGMGKAAMQLSYAQNVVQKTNKNVLILTPLAVAEQAQREAEKFGIEAKVSDDGKVKSKITITNFQKLHKFDKNDFVGTVIDESSIIKNFNGKTRIAITDFMRKQQYRFLYTATAAPNDYIELGTSSEVLGYLGYIDMLTKFFKNEQNSIAQNSMYGVKKGDVLPKWRFKGHAEQSFWRWVASWAKAMRMPSDIGFEDGDFILPEKIEKQYVIEASRELEGRLFPIEAIGLREQREERRQTYKERCEKIVDLVENQKQSLIWCEYNYESDYLAKIIPDAVEVAGKHTDEQKKERLLAFANGDIKRLITKPKIGAWGLNFQNCNHMTFFPTHSFEQYYQAVRRAWRFGQKNKVQIDIVSTKGESKVLDNLQRKAKQADRMFEHLIKYMNNGLKIENNRVFDKKLELPKW